MKIKLSKNQWEFIGRKTGWMKTALINDYTGGYCPKCKSRLFPGDTDYMDATGVCSSCVSYDVTPDQRYKKAFEEYMEKKKIKKNMMSICPNCGSTDIIMNGNKARCNNPKCKSEFEFGAQIQKD